MQDELRQILETDLYLFSFKTNKAMRKATVISKRTNIKINEYKRILSLEFETYIFIIFKLLFFFSKFFFV
jgi:hypothetical protein